jgi:SAM-dependent methyltransferase
MIEIRKQPTVSDQWSKDSYETIYGTVGIRHTDSFYAWLVGLMRVEPGCSLLDISCGEGSLGRLAAQAGAQSFGLDLSEAAVRAGLAETRQARFVVGNAQDLPFGAGTFDRVSNIGSLEHYLDPARGAAEMARVMRPEGLACVLLPNIYSLLDNVWHAFRHGRTVEDNQPIQRYAARFEWQDLLEANGLVVERTVKYEREFPTRWADVGHYLRRPKALVRLAFTPFLPLNLASCFVYLCRKRT